MNEAARLRVQKAYSTDPAYLERMAPAEEARERALRGEAQSKLSTSDQYAGDQEN